MSFPAALLGKVPARLRVGALCGAWLLLACLLAPAPAQAQGAADIGQMSIEDLMNVDVTSVSRRAQRLQDAAAAVYVLTSEDIRRSGATSIPEALRLVPGVHVARIDSNKWSVSVRGFTGRYANKLLVLVDGRSVYTPLFSGVFWDLVRVPLNTIERIEVIRGPGATLWGANAVNGVINIITRSATASAGVHAMVTTGTEDQGLLSLSVGGQLSAKTAVSADASVSFIDGSAQATPDPRSADNWKSGRFGVRVDSKVTDRDDLSLQAVYAGSRINDVWNYPTLQPPFGELVYDQARHANAFGSAEWTRRGSAGETVVRGVFEHSSIREGFAGEERRTLQAEVQRTQQFGKRHTAVFGASHRQSNDDLLESAWASFSPQARTLRWQSVFAQDDVALAGERLRLTAGVKMEHNDYTGWETQPNVRAIVSVTPKQSLWGAVSRAVRLPSRGEADASLWLFSTPLPGIPVPAAVILEGLGANADAEVMTAFEGGYRYQVGNTASFDVSLFDQHYDRLRNLSAPVVTFAHGEDHGRLGRLPSGVNLLEITPHVDALVPMAFDATGRRRGLEVSADWRPQTRVRVTGSASWLGGQTSGLNGPASLIPVTNDAPERIGLVRLALNLPTHLEVDAAVRYVSRLRSTGVPSYVTADTRVGFRLSNVNLAVVGRNLLAREHQEFIAEFFSLGRPAAERAVVLQATFTR